MILGSLSTRVFETWTATGREHFACQNSGVSQICILIIFKREKILCNINVVVRRQVKRENNSIPVAVRVSKTRVLKLPIVVLSLTMVSWILKSGPVLGFHSGDQQPRFSTKAKEKVCIIVGFNSQRIGSGHQHAVSLFGDTDMAEVTSFGTRELLGRGVVDVP